VATTSPAVSQPHRHPAATIGITSAVLAFDFVLLAIGVGGIGPLLHHARALTLFASWLIAYPALALFRPPMPDRAAETRPDPLVVTSLFAIPVVTPMLSAWAERAGLWLLPGGMVLRWAGVVLAILGLGLRVLAMRQLGARFSPLPAVQRDHTLETQGIYGAVRHPGYVGAWICELGIVLAFGSAATLPLALAMAWALAARVRHEEALLESRFGDVFRDYRRRTGGFLPHLGGGR